MLRSLATRYRSVFKSLLVTGVAATLVVSPMSVASAEDGDTSPTAAAILSGSVLNPSGTPIADATLNAYAVDSPDLVATTVADEMGVFVFTTDEVISGDYELEVVDPGGVAFWWEGVMDRADATVITLSESAPVEVTVTKPTPDMPATEPAEREPESQTDSDAQAELELESGPVDSSRQNDDAGATPPASRMALEAELGTITGTVSGASGKLEGVYVDALRWEDTDWGGWYTNVASGWTLADGTYTIDHLPAGTYTVQFSDSEGAYVRAYLGGAASTEESETFELAAGGIASGKDITLVLGGSASGTVFGVDGPLGGVHVAAHRWVDNEWGGWYTNVASGWTLADGTYTIDHLPAGTYALEFSDSEGAYVRAYLGGAASTEESDTFELTAGGIASGKDITLVLGGSASGTVFGVDGPLGGVSVEAYRRVDNEWGSYYSFVASGWTLPDGTYTIGGLSAGTYTLVFSDSESAYVRAYLGGAANPIEADNFELESGGTAAGNDITLALGGTITGTVVGASGPLVGVHVYAYRWVDSEWGGYYTSVSFGLTRADGTYTLDGLAAGRYTVEFNDVDGDHVRAYLGGAAYSNEADRFDLELGGTAAGIDITLALGGTIQGTVLGASGPLAGVIVNARRWVDNEWGGHYSSQEAPGSTRADGAYTIKGLPAGRYILEFNDVDGDHVRAYLGGTLSPDEADAFELASGETTSGKDITLVLGGTIRGTVTGQAGPLSAVHVGALRWTEDAFGAGYRYETSVSTSADGDYTLQGLPAGTYTVIFASNSADYPATYLGSVFEESAAQTLALSLGELADGKDITLTRGATLSGTVSDSSVPLARAEVRLLRWNEMTDRYSFESSTTTDVSGRYTLTGLRPGQYTVQFNHVDYVGTFYGDTSVQASADRFSLELDEDTDVGNSTMQAGPGGQLNVSVHGVELVPADHLNIWRTSDGEPELVRTPAANAGDGYRTYFNIQGLAPGSYAIEAIKPDETTQFYGGTTASNATHVQVTAGDEVDIIFDLAELVTGSVSGVVTGQDGPLANVTVEVFQKNGEAFTSLRMIATSPTGTYWLPDLPAGTYTLKFTDLANRYESAYLGGVSDINSAERFTISPGAAISKNVTLTPHQTGGFSDVVHGQGFAAQISWMVERGITNGYADGTFRPRNEITREAMAAFLYRFAGEPEYAPPVVSPFSDLPTSHGFYKEISWLVDQGVTTGYADGTFRPRNQITREAMAAFLYRFAGEPEYAPPVVSPFSDLPTSHGFYKEISWLVDQGVTTGYADGTFRPKNPITREATAAFLYRFDGALAVV